ncbi:MAG: zinc ABC transporter substrate-binding protein [bacterium]
MIKNIMFFCSIFIFLFSGCSHKTEKEETSNKINVFVTVVPQIGIVKQIAGDLVNVRALVSTGTCPETFSPSPRQIEDLSKANVFLDLGLPFEDVWLKKIHGAKNDIKVIPMSTGINLRNIDDETSNGDKDPHLWFSLKNALIMAQNTTKILSELMPQHTELFSKNLKIYETKIKVIDIKTKNKYAKLKDKNIYVFHPVFGYIADDYGLKQIPIEIEGKEPSAKQLANLISNFKKQKVSTIFIEPEFSSKIPNTIAKELNAELVSVSIYNEDILTAVEEFVDKWK